MKKMFLSMLVMAFASFSFAGNEGPQAAPELPTPVIAERTLSGGFFVAPGSPYAYSIQILIDGTVVKTEWIRGEGKDEEKYSVITTLSSNRLKTLRKLIKSIQPGDMYDPNPKDPRCQDAPMSRDLVHKNGVQIEIAKNAGCKKFARQNATSADLRIIKILDALEKLAQD